MDNTITWNIPNAFSSGSMDLNDKDNVVSFLNRNMLQKTLSMFEWKNLPQWIPQQDLEFMLQHFGYAAFIKHEGKYFATLCHVGGINNYNYRPTLVTVSNPYLLNGSKQYNVYYCEDDFVNKVMYPEMPSDECVVIQNDPFYAGIMQLCSYYSTQLAENVQSKRLVTILSRATNIFVAEDEDVKNDFKDFISLLVRGEFSAVLADDLVAKTKTMPLSEKGHQALTDLIEDQQYIKASWLNDLGLQANYNMKRESINSNESQLNKDAVLPFVDTMLSQRKLACERINKLFNLNVSVDFNSAWKYTRTTIEQAIEAIDNTTEVAEDDINKDEPNQLGSEVLEAEGDGV